MKNVINALSLDLGSNLGWSRAVCTLRPELNISIVDHGTVYLDELTTDRMKKEFNEVLDRQRVKLMVAEDVIRKLINSANFDCFITEDIFLNPTLVSAFKSLLLYMDVYERIVNVEKHKRLYKIPAKVIKKHISAYGGSDKSDVQRAVLSNQLITIKNHFNATEHEFDSIAATWGFTKEYLLTLG